MNETLNPSSSVFICVPFGKAKRLHLWFQILNSELFKRSITYPPSPL